MSQSENMASHSDAVNKVEEQPESPSFTLQVVSPSVGVSSPLSFQRLPTTTTIKQLKARIRDALPSKPTDESQRLIHRGRMLAREAETMLEIFGQETLASTEVQTLHLVLRPTVAESTTAQIPIVPAAVQQPGTPTPIPPHFPPRPQSTPANPVQNIHQVLQHGMHTQQPLPGFQNVNQHHMVHQVEQIQNLMGQRLQQLQRETQRLHNEMGLLEQRARNQMSIAGARNQMAATATAHGQQAVAGQNPLAATPALTQLFGRQPQPGGFPSVQTYINQQQQERAADGHQGIQNGGPTITQGPSGRSSPSLHRPDHTTTYTREGIGPNGERWQMTVNETTTTVPLSHPHALHQHPSHPNAALDIQALLRNADRFNHNNMQRSTSAAGVTRPGTPSSITTPATTSSSPSASTLLNPSLNSQLPMSNANSNIQGTALSNSAVNIQGANTSTNSQAISDPMVYILSSSSGPRALLVSNTETFYTPRQSSRRHHGHSAATNGVQPAVLPEFRNRQAHRAARHNRRDVNEPGVQQPIPAPHANPGAGAMAAQLGPLLWLVVRLVGFVWFFTAGNQSWTRWLMVSGLAFIVFIINTGVLNGAADQILGPIRRHLENLIPLAGPDAALVPAANAVPRNPERNAAQGENGPPRRGEPDPAQVAARLLAERRQADVGWIMTQMRRIEHAALLFLASLVPGVGERHIAAREAEANAAEAERQRQADAANAANASENANETVETDTGNGAAVENPEENRGDMIEPPVQPVT